MPALLAALVVVPLSTPLSNKFRFLRVHNLTTELEVKMGSAWGLGHQRRQHLFMAASRVPPALLRDGLNMEFGTRHGEGLRWLATDFNQTSWHGFDSWQGLPTDVSSSKHWHEGKYSTGGVLPDMSCCLNVRLHKGWFNETVESFIQSQPPDRPVGFAHLDADVYSSTVTVLDAIFRACAHRNGTVLSFDELFGSLEQERHEWKALLESAAKYGFSWRFVTYALTPASPFARAAVQVTDVGERCRTRERRDP